MASETPPSALDHPNDETKTDLPNDESLRGPGEQNGDHIATLCSRWEALGLRNANGTASTCGPSERSAIANRVADVGPELVELAIVGAGDDPWLRKGGARSALAWVMNDADSVRRFADRGAAVQRTADEEAAAAAKRSQREAVQARRAAIWARSPWIPRTAPLPFLKALERGDFDAAESMLDGGSCQEQAAAIVARPDDGSRGLVPIGLHGKPAPDGPAHIAPAVARHFARLLDRAADLAELRGAAGQLLLGEPGANDTEGT
jgi:hypothetical protein